MKCSANATTGRDRDGISCKNDFSHVVSTISPTAAFPGVKSSSTPDGR